MAPFPSGEKSVETVTSPPADSHRGDPESGVSSLSLDKDVAIGLVGEHAQEIDAEVEQTVLRKIDWFLIPAMIVGMASKHHFLLSMFDGKC